MTLSDYLQGAKSSLFRFEYLQDFNIPDERKEFELYKKTGNIATESMQEWRNFLEAKHREGVVTERVRLVREPVSEYVEWELKLHRESQKHGDTIKILTEKDLTEELNKIGDFWLIDETIFLKMNYGAKGEYIGYEETGDIQGVNLKQYLLKNSKPLLD